MLIIQIFWRMFVALLIFEIGIYPLILLLPNVSEIIMWKLTIFYGLFGVLLMISGLVLKKGLIGLIKPSGIDLPVFIWPRIDIYYSVVFLVLAAANTWFVLFMTIDQWVNFKMFAPDLILVCYTVLVSFLVSKDIVKNERMQSEVTEPRH